MSDDPSVVLGLALYTLAGAAMTLIAYVVVLGIRSRNGRG